MLETARNIISSDATTQEMIAPVIDTLVATKVWSVGEEFIYAGTLYKVTTAIAVGDTIVLGSGGNADTASTVSEEAYRINDPSETDIANGDYIPFFDTSANAKKKSLWSNIINKLKTYFDGIYVDEDSLATVATTGAYSDLTGEPTNQSASSGSSTVSLCTRGEKYTWNNKSNALSVSSVNITCSSIAANSVKDFTKSATKSGYTPLGIVGVEVNAGGNYVTTVSAFINASGTASVRLCNTGSSAYTPTSIDVDVLYVKN